jgi:hypothetical protein
LVLLNIGGSPERSASALYSKRDRKGVPRTGRSWAQPVRIADGYRLRLTRLGLLVRA